LERPILQTRWRASQMLWALRECTGIVCVSHSLKELAVAHGIDDAKISVIPNAVNRDLFRPGDRAAARADLGIAPDVRLVVCVAMLVYGKGQHLLLNAVTRLRMKYPDLRLALVGAPSHEPRYPQLLQKLIAQGGLAEVVNLPGPQSPQHVVKWLQAADLFALPSFDEGCCNAVLEAMAC